MTSQPTGPDVAAPSATAGRRLWFPVPVLAESGEAVLPAANPQKHEELGRFRATDGKTWNHPTLVHGRLYVRDAEEMTCDELPLETEQAGPDL